MKFSCHFISAFIFFLGCISADATSYIQDIRGKSMGNTGIASESLSNPSAVSFSGHPFVILGYENRFNIKELAEYSGGLAFPNPRLDGSAYLFRSGYEHYSENLFHIAFSKKLCPRFSLGVSLNYFFFQTSEEPDDQWKLSSDIGFTWKINDDLTCGTTLSNLIITESGENFPLRQRLRLGLSYFVAPTFEVCLEYDKMFRYAACYKIGIDYQITDGLFIRTGFFGKPFSPTAGLGYRLKNCRFDLAADNHPYLGLSTSIGLIYFFK